MILDDIIAHKRIEVAERRQQVSVEALSSRLSFAPPPRPFADALKRFDGQVGLIAEVKKASPSAGVIRADFDPVQIALEYLRAGADCLSVLTDTRYFMGHLNYLKDIRHAVSLPLLRKDFIIDPYQIYEARAAGADAVLLIVAALSFQELSDYQALARDLGMDSLVETHTEDEMAAALEVGATLIGINARDLTRFVTDLDVIVELAALLPPGVVLVGESGIRQRGDVQRLVGAGVHAILVGETFMRAPSITEAVHTLCR